MKFKMKWAAAAAAALLTCGVSAQADNYDLTYQAIETQMLIGDVSQFSSELDGAMTKVPAESAKNTEVSEKTPRIVLVEKGDAYGATLVDGKVIIPVVNTNLMDVSPQVELLQENGMKGITASDGKVLLLYLRNGRISSWYLMKMETPSGLSVKMENGVLIRRKGKRSFRQCMMTSCQGRIRFLS